MMIHPVRYIRAPGYPGKDAVISDPGLLRMLPRRWRGGRAVFAAGVTASLAALAGCGMLPGATPTPEPPLGGVPMPPAYVSEADAVKIIRSAVGKSLPDITENVPLGPDGKEVVYVTDDGTDVYRLVKAAETAVDLYDGKAGAGFEYFDAAGADNGKFEITGEAVPADKERAYVYVVQPVETGDGSAVEADIRKQVTRFLEWLKAEGIQ